MFFANTPAFGSMSADDLKGYLAAHREREFVLVDVREAPEYRRGHIPGARLIPLASLEETLPALDTAKAHIFYCHSGGRSRQACRLAAQAGRGLVIHNLDGGMLAWGGATVPDTPRIELFANAATLPDMLQIAMDLEKAAHDLYATLAMEAGPPAVCELMRKLVGLEKAHAMILYKLMRKNADDRALPAFETMFAALPGKVLEGGKSVADLEPWIAEARTGDCMAFAELALEVEAHAQDLYRALAHGANETALEKVFLDLAQQEKSHSRVIMESLASIADIDR